MSEDTARLAAPEGPNASPPEEAGAAGVLPALEALRRECEAAQEQLRAITARVGALEALAREAGATPRTESVAGSEDLASSEESSVAAGGGPLLSTDPTVSKPTCDALRGGSARGLAEPRRTESESESEPENPSTESESEPENPSTESESESESEPEPENPSTESESEPEPESENPSTESEPEPEPPSTATESETESPSAEPEPAARQPVPAGEVRSPELALGQTWLLIAGVTLTVLGIGFFLKFAFDQAWIGAWGRVGIGYAAGIAMMAVGRFFRRRELPAFGLILLGGGLAIHYFAGYAAFQLYELIDQPTAFALMVAVTALSGYLAVAHDTQWLAVLGLIGGFLTPLVLSTGTDRQIVLMSYLLILNVGVLGLALVKQWGLLNFLGFGCTWLQFSVWFVERYTDEAFWATTVFQTLFFLIYALVPYLYHFLRAGVELRGFFITLPNAFLGLLFTLITVHGHFESFRPAALFTLGCAALFFALAGRLARKEGRPTGPVAVFLGKGLLFLGVSAPVLLAQDLWTAAWTLEGIAFLWVGFRVRSAGLRGLSLCLLCGATFKLLFVDPFTVYGLEILLRGPDLSYVYAPGYAADALGRWLAWAAVIGSWFAVARWYRREGEEEPEAQGALLTGFATFLLLTALTHETATAAGEYAARGRFAAISVLWALFAAGLMAVGFRLRVAAWRHAAIGLFFLTAAKVVLADMARASTPFRIVSFLGLGVLLIGASYLYHRFAQALAEPEPE